MYLPSIVLEEVDLLAFWKCSSQVLQELAVGLCSKRIIHLFYCNNFVTAADCCTYGLTWLVACSVLHSDVLIGLAPRLQLEPPGTENAFVGEHQVATAV